MFLSKSHLPQLLNNEAYFTPDQHEKELASLFLPGWHCVATMTDLPSDGAYKTFDLFGRPLLIWRKDEEVHCYLNVCAHRFCLLTDRSAGRCDMLKCQYHGWEYNVDGDTQRIPDAKSFRPLAKGELGLRKFRAERVGQLVFVSLSEDALSLRDYLGRGYELSERLFPVGAQLVLAAIRPNHANWKVALENSLEGYHLETVHAQTFGSCPDESICKHELYDEASAMRVEDDQQSSALHKMGQAVLRAAGVREQLNYHQFHRYPNLVVAKFGIFSWLETTIPTSPTDSYDIWRFFYIGSAKNSWRAWPVAWACHWWGKRWFAKVIGEDEAVFPAIQQGLVSPSPPGSGLVSIREERIFHFQSYVNEKVGPDLPAARAEQSADQLHGLRKSASQNGHVYQ